MTLIFNDAEAVRYVLEKEAEWGLPPAANPHTRFSYEGPECIDVVTDLNRWTVWVEDLDGDAFIYGEC